VVIVVVVSAVNTRAADFGGSFPDKLSEVPGFFGEAHGGYVIVFDGFVAPGDDGGGGVWVAVGEVFAVGAVLLFGSWLSGYRCGIMWTYRMFPYALLSPVLGVGSESVVPD